jgi:hypothetical protein
VSADFLDDQIDTALDALETAFDAYCEGDEDTAGVFACAYVTRLDAATLRALAAHAIVNDISEVFSPSRGERIRRALRRGAA